MESWFAVATLAFLLLFCIMCYSFQIPETLRQTGPGGRWGPPNAEFNWCEADYQLADWLAEPVNTFSNVIFICQAAGFLALHDASGDVTLLAVLVMAIGVGSMLFHGSLRYRMQLCDEEPMLWFALLAAASALRRLRGWEVTVGASAWAALISAAVLLTEQRSLAHEALRAAMSFSFVAGILVVAWGSTAMVVRLKVQVGGKTAQRAEKLHTAGFFAFALAIVCWLADNYLCPVLQQLPLGLPYPHLHMWWHLLTAAALYSLLIIWHLDDCCGKEALKLKYAMGFLPVVLSA